MRGWLQRFSFFLIFIWIVGCGGAKAPVCMGHVLCNKLFEPVRFRRAEPEHFGDKFFIPTVGKVTVVDFWATWCEPCMNNMRRLNTLASKWREKGAVAFAINGMESVDNIKNTLRDDPRMSGIEIPVAADTEAKLAMFFESKDADSGEEKKKDADLPLILVFDAQGALRMRVTAEDGDYLAIVDETVNALLEEK
jgi:thiol-disulfide isomerase/thioredoxin